jgi:Na+-transporting NADH:ubiquinone oxidoreductase subunit B
MPKLINWQQPMVRVLKALAPLIVFAVYLFGWRIILMLLLVNAAGFLTEYMFTRRWKEPVSSAVFVTGCLYTLSLPPALPLWMAVAGVVFAVLFGKMVFGGFGRNVFNPALTGRAFVYVCFGNYMTSMWTEPLRGAGGGFLAYAAGADAVTQATPGMVMKTAGSAAIPLLDLFVGTTSGTIGGTSALLAIVGGLYLLWTKAANYRIVTSCVLGYLAVETALWLAGVAGVVDPLHAVLGGSFVVGAFFYATDPVSASQTNEGRWIYGAFIGVMSCLITVFSAWPAGTMFAILLANTFAPLLDYVVRELKNRSAAGKPA